MHLFPFWGAIGIVCDVQRAMVQNHKKFLGWTRWSDLARSKNKVCQTSSRFLREQDLLWPPFIILFVPSYNKWILFPRFKLKAVYMYVAGFYTYSIFALLFWETRRSDFGISMTHHVATVCLIALSYIFRYTGYLDFFIYLWIQVKLHSHTSFFSTHTHALTVCEYFFIVAVAF